MQVHKSIKQGRPFFRFFPPGLTCLLSEGSGFALAVVRHRDHADVVVDAGLQAVHGVLAGRRLDKVLEDGDALTGRRDGDPVAGDGGGVEGRPAEADAGVTHVLEGDVAHLRHFCGRERVVGEGRGKKERKKHQNKQKGKKMWGRGGVGIKSWKEENDRKCG